jgi:hydrogenase nickel incorporation protein HypA/HybF
MHELSLMEGIVNIAEKTAAEHHFKTIKKIRLVLGELTSAYPDALLAAFEAWSDDPMFRDTVLEIESVPISASCIHCEHTFQPDKFRFECPLCCSRHVEMGQGQEFYIDFIEGA